MTPIFTIITPCFNSEKTIGQTLESVLNQTVQDYEYLIMDGGSTDGTLDIIRKYEVKFNGKMRYWSEPDNGIYDAMNKGIQKASGEIVGIINSDDWYEKDALENILSMNSDDKYLIFHGMMRTIDSETGKEIRIAIYSADYLQDAMINHPTVFVKKEVYQDFGIFDCRYKSGADYEMMIRFYNTGQVKFVPIYRTIANFRTGGMSASVNALKEAMQIKFRYGLMTKSQYIAASIFLFSRKIFRYMPR